MSNKILICDDEEGVRESLNVILEKDYELILAENGRQCLDCLKNSRDIDLVLLDIKMPKMHGLDVLKAIREHHPDMKVAFITGYKSVETATEAARLGVTGYVIKPFESKDVLDMVKESLKGS